MQGAVVLCSSENGSELCISVRIGSLEWLNLVCSWAYGRRYNFYLNLFKRPWPGPPKNNKNLLLYIYSHWCAFQMRVGVFVAVCSRYTPWGCCGSWQLQRSCTKSLVYAWSNGRSARRLWRQEEKQTGRAEGMVQKMGGIVAYKGLGRGRKQARWNLMPLRKESIGPILEDWSCSFFLLLKICFLRSPCSSSAMPAPPNGKMQKTKFSLTIATATYKL